ncbi:hypothetical protein Lal_00046932 [Lupinus albus]|nr:hypothetical protein Lal_00046932 [Lupinus albus]
MDSLVNSGFLWYPLKTVFPLTHISPHGGVPRGLYPISETSSSCTSLYTAVAPTVPSMHISSGKAQEVTRKNSSTSGLKAAPPDIISRTRPPSRALT